MSNVSTRLFYSFINDPNFSFNYFNRDKRLSAKKGGKPWRIMKPQLDYLFGTLLNKVVLIASGRSTGKTSSFEHIMFTTAISNPKKWTGYIVRNQRHVTVLEQHLLEYFNKDEFTRSFLTSYDKKSRIFSLSNGHKIEMRLVGQDKTGATTLVSGHYNFLFIDEAQILNRIILHELLPAVMEGGKIFVAGVPNNIRDSVLYYYVSQYSQNFEETSVMYYRYASYESEDWDMDKEKRAREIYGGEHTDAYKNLVCGCLTPEQLIFTKRGLVPIKNIVLNDEVITHKNQWKKVTRLFKFEYNGPIHNIKTAYDDNILSITPEHPISSKKCRWKTIRDPKKRTAKLVSDLDFRLPLDLIKGDKIQFPQISSIYSNNLIDKNFAYALGLFFAEGSSDKYHIKYSLHRKEIYLIDKLNIYFKNSPSIRYNKYDLGMDASYGNVKLSKIIRDYIYGTAINKTFSNDIFEASKEFKIEFLKGIFDGDGHRRVRKYKEVFSTEYTISLATINGIYQVRLLLRQLGINCSITHLPKCNTNKIFDKRLNEFRTINANEVYRIDIYGWYACELDVLFGYNSENIFKNIPHYVSDFKDYSTILSNEITQYNGYVYNLEVEDDGSYTVSDKVVHNCWGDSASSVFRPSKLVDGLIDNPYFRFKEYRGNSFEELFPQLNLPMLIPKYNFYVIGADIGVTNAPTHVIVLGVYQKGDVEHYDVLYRLEMSQTSPFAVSKALNYLLDYFNCKHCAIDAQTMGQAVYDNLCNRELFPATYNRNKMYVMPIIFNKPLIMGQIKSIDQISGREITEDVKCSMKNAATMKLVELVEAERLHISQSETDATSYDDMVTIMIAETQTACTKVLHPFTYSNSVNDHAVDGLRCCGLVISLIIEKGLFRGGYGEPVRIVRLSKSIFHERKAIPQRRRRHR